MGCSLTLLKSLSRLIRLRKRHLRIFSTYRRVRFTSTDSKMSFSACSHILPLIAREELVRKKFLANMTRLARLPCSERLTLVFRTRGLSANQVRPQMLLLRPRHCNQVAFIQADSKDIAAAPDTEKEDVEGEDRSQERPKNMNVKSNRQGVKKVCFYKRQQDTEIN